MSYEHSACPLSAVVCLLLLPKASDWAPTRYLPGLCSAMGVCPKLSTLYNLGCSKGIPRMMNSMPMAKLGETLNLFVRELSFRCTVILVNSVLLIVMGLEYAK